MGKKELVINIRKVMAMYLLGFSFANFIPEKYFFLAVNKSYKKLAENVEVIERKDYYSIN